MSEEQTPPPVTDQAEANAEAAPVDDKVDPK